MNHKAYRKNQNPKNPAKCQQLKLLTVTPNELTPNGRLWLTDLDQVVRRSHTPLIFIYKLKQNHSRNLKNLSQQNSCSLLYIYIL
jgi:hypothetical protein